MRLLIVLGLVVAVQAGVVKESSDGVYIRDIYYEKQLIVAGLNEPFALAVDYKTDTLYFRSTIDDDKVKSTSYSLKSGRFKVIDYTPNGYCHAVDRQNNLVYIGTEHGIYVCNEQTGVAELYGAADWFIWTLFFKDGTLFFSEHPSQNLYTYSNGSVTLLKELEDTKVHFFVIDIDNDTFFSNNTGLYKRKKWTGETILYKNFEDGWDLRALTLDTNGELYAAMKDGIYRVMRKETKLEKLLFDDVNGLTFDGDNTLIYINQTSIIKLIPITQGNNKSLI